MSDSLPVPMMTGECIGAAAGTALARSPGGAMWLSIQLVGTECLRLKIDGTLDVTTVPVLEPMLVSLVDRRPRYVELDLSRLRTIDVVGAGALLGFYKRLRTAGSVFNWSGLCDQPLAVFRMLRLDRHLGDVDLEACWS